MQGTIPPNRLRVPKDTYEGIRALRDKTTKPKPNALPFFIERTYDTATQQIPSNPALDFAQSILDETNNGLELIEILRDIAEDCDEKANTNDRIAATNILNDRAFGKPPSSSFTVKTQSPTLLPKPT